MIVLKNKISTICRDIAYTSTAIYLALILAVTCMAIYTQFIDEGTVQIHIFFIHVYTDHTYI